MPDPNLPTDAELKERIERALKDTELFHRVSRRLLADMIEVIGLRHLEGPVNLGPPRKPAVLIVLERAIRIRFGSNIVVLRRGTYVATDAVMVGINWTHAKIEPEPSDPMVRVFIVTRHFFRNRMPTVIVNTLDPATLHEMHLVI